MQSLGHHGPDLVLVLKVKDLVEKKQNQLNHSPFSVYFVWSDLKVSSID